MTLQLMHNQPKHKRPTLVITTYNISCQPQRLKRCQTPKSLTKLKCNYIICRSWHREVKLTDATIHAKMDKLNKQCDEFTGILSKHYGH